VSFIRRPNILGNHIAVAPKTPNRAAPAMIRWKCATTKKVSWSWMSGALWPSHTPLSPPLMKSETTPMAHSIGVLYWMRERHRVASQLKTFTADGTAMRIVPTAKAMAR
jgi:hypothetical protein